MASLTLDGVSFSYEPGKPILEDLSLSVADGERHAILGASGAGKTTLLNVLSGLLTPTSGRILFDTDDVTHEPAAARSLTQVFQFPVLYEALSVQANLEFALRNHGDFDAEASDRIGEIVTELGLLDALGKKPKQLSLYEKQLVAVAKAIARTNTRLVLLDEPLTAVDPKRKWQMRQVLRRIQEKFKLTMIYVTHDQTEAMAFADRVSLLTTEGIAQTGTPQELYEAPATRFVGYFVGSPGMNFVPGTAIGRDEAVGFRPNWAQIGEAGDGPSLEGTINAFRPMPEGGIAYIQTDYGEIAVIADDCKAGQVVKVQLPRFACFVDDRLTSVVGRVS